MDLTKTFALLLVTELPYHMARAQGLPLTIELSEDWESVLEKGNVNTKELKESGEHFYEEGGSVFSDYEILRGIAVPQGGMRTIAKRFRFDMSSKEIVSLATEVVGEWQASVGKERKG